MPTKRCEKCNQNEAFYNEKHAKGRKYCKSCVDTYSIPNMINKKMINKICSVYTCLTLASLNDSNNKPYCKPCADDLNINVTKYHGVCIQCNKKYATYGKPGTKSPITCKPCGEPLGYIDVKHPKCETCKKIQPNFNYAGLPAKFCIECADDDMVNVNRKKCTTCNNLFAYYCNRDETSPTHCINCRTNNMYNPIAPQCQNCKLYASFGSDGKRTHCSRCKKDEHVPINRRQCIHPDCKLEPVFNFDGESIGLCCFSHKEANMVNVRAKRCINCKQNRAYYNVPGSPAEYCNNCADDTMIIIYTHPCQFPGCYNKAKCGTPGMEKTTCVRHKQLASIHDPTIQCEIAGCCNPATYGNQESKRQIVCDKHKTNEHNICFEEFMCSQCQKINILNSEQLCTNCDPNSFLGSRLEKQNQIRDLLELHGYSPIIDKANSKNCRYRPDFKFVLSTHIVIIEVDENQHSYYQSNDYQRMKEIQQDNDCKTIFIRYNPDKYNRTQNPPIETRFPKLKEKLDTCLSIVPTQSEIHYLFFDKKIKNHSL